GENPTQQSLRLKSDSLPVECQTLSSWAMEKEITLLKRAQVARFYFDNIATLTEFLLQIFILRRKI
ncbi:MAG: hypothetical protein IJZ73_05305, partial [Clostridia bacterium]|nr:hypothetical protein [Clostridia bacterium]